MPAALALPTRQPGLLSSLMELTKLPHLRRLDLHRRGGLRRYRRGPTWGWPRPSWASSSWPWARAPSTRSRSATWTPAWNARACAPPLGVFTPPRPRPIAGGLALAGFWLLLAAHNLTTALPRGPGPALVQRLLPTPLKAGQRLSPVVPGSLHRRAAPASAGPPPGATPGPLHPGPGLPVLHLAGAPLLAAGLPSRRRLRGLAGFPTLN